MGTNNCQVKIPEICQSVSVRGQTQRPTPFSMNFISYFLLYFKNNFCLFIFGFVVSSLLDGLFSSCGEQGLLPSRGAGASHCGGSPVAEHRL